MSTSVELTIANFTYTKAQGDSAHRQILVLSKPEDSYLGIEIEQGNDLTSIQPMIDYLTELEIAKEKLRAKHGLKEADLKYRRFKSDKISALIESNITVK